MASRKDNPPQAQARCASGGTAAIEAAMRLAEAAIARLCHDLGGSLGAALNGLELAATPEIAEEAMRLAADAAQEVAARLRLARAIWATESPLQTRELPPLAQGLPHRARFQLDLTGIDEGTLAPSSARLVLASLSLAAEALHGGGKIALAGDPAREVVLMIEGLRAAWPEDLPVLLAEPARALDDPAPRGITAHLVALLAANAGATISFLLATSDATHPPPLLLRFA